MERVAREEFLRFALLIVLTIGLASLAFRLDSHSSSPHSSSPQPGAHGRPHVSPSSAAITPQVLPTESTRQLPGGTSHPGGAAGSGSASGGSGAASGGTGAAGGSGGGGGGGPAGAGTAPVGGSKPTLPVTGWDGAVRLGGLALVLIGGGAALRVAGRAPHPALPPSAHRSAGDGNA